MEFEKKEKIDVDGFVSNGTEFDLDIKSNMGYNFNFTHLILKNENQQINEERGENEKCLINVPGLYLGLTNKAN